MSKQTRESDRTHDAAVNVRMAIEVCQSALKSLDEGNYLNAVLQLQRAGRYANAAAFYADLAELLATSDK